MALGQSIVVVPGLFHWTYILNHGAAFGILRDQRIFFLAIVVILLVCLAYKYKEIAKGPSYLKLGTGLLLAGALGNAIDRFVQDGVVDFFDFLIWPIFNVADIGIVIGIFLVAYYMIASDSEDE
jgi:lipoprotein signal peptidase